MLFSFFSSKKMYFFEKIFLNKNKHLIISIQILFVCIFKLKYALFLKIYLL